MTCQAGVTTKCASCPAMHHCGVFEPLKIGPDGFPVPGQLSVWGEVPYPDQSGAAQPTTAQLFGQPQIPSTTAQQGSEPQGQAADQTVDQSQSMDTQMGQSMDDSGTAQSPQVAPTQVFGQPQTQSQQVFGQPTTPGQPVGQPLSLYQDNTMSAGGCSAKTAPCDCHYASCTPSGDCICGWDAASKTCRAGVTTKCVSCPAMHHCGTSETLKIGPDGFPVPGQLSVWGQVPYPDQTGKAMGKGKAGKAKGKGKNNGTAVSGNQ